LKINFTNKKKTKTKPEDYIYLLFSTKKMSFIKKANILYLLLPIAVLTSCKKKSASDEKAVIEIKDSELPKNVLPKMKPMGKEMPLTADYIKEKRIRIDAFVKKNWPNNSMNGGFLVAKNGQIIYEKYEGFSNLRDKTPITDTTSIHIASVSKVLTATAVLKLVNAKRIDLDQKVTDFLPKFPYPDVTVRMLLCHRSGMRSYAYFTDRDKSVWDRHNTLTNQDILTIMGTKNIKLEQKTGTRFAYCNTNYAMLALIIEKVTKLSYRDAMAQIIFRPLGMTHTFVLDFDKDKHNVAPSYKANRVEIGIDYLDKIYGDKNIYSTPRDLLKFDRARNSPSFLEPELLVQVYTGYSNERKGTKNYGLGIRMINWDNGKNFYFHNGWWHGFTSSYITLKDENVTIIALSNKFSRNTYAVRKLSVIFGDYPFKIEDTE
jgi:CubicO group peptidase (beta-lactamase class C family)